MARLDSAFDVTELEDVHGQSINDTPVQLIAPENTGVKYSPYQGPINHTPILSVQLSILTASGSSTWGKVGWTATYPSFCSRWDYTCGITHDSLLKSRTSAGVPLRGAE